MTKWIGTFFTVFGIWVASMAQSSVVAAEPNAQQAIGASGNPLPRFVALQSEKVHMRTGPGTHYPIDWVYRRQSLPVEVIDEHGPWRKVRDHDGTVGWIHVQLLKGPRYALVRGKTRSLYAEKDLASPVLVIAEAGVTGRLISCEDIWCQLYIENREAWIERRHLWGVYDNETIN